MGLNKVEGEKPSAPFPGWLHKLLNTKDHKKYVAAREIYEACVKKCESVGPKDIVGQQGKVLEFEERRGGLHDEYQGLRVGNTVEGTLLGLLTEYSSAAVEGHPDDVEDEQQYEAITHTHDDYRAVDGHDNLEIERR